MGAGNDPLGLRWTEVVSVFSAWALMGQYYPWIWNTLRRMTGLKGPFDCVTTRCCWENGQNSLRGTSWTAAHQAPLSMGFSRQGYWNRLSFPSPGYLSPAQGLNPSLLYYRQILYCLSQQEALYDITVLIKVPFFFLMLSSLYLVQQIYSNCSCSERGWLERLLDHIANGILLLSQSLRVTPQFLRRGLGSWWGLQGTTWKVDKNNSPGLSTLSLSSPHRGEGAWGVSSEVPGPGREDCLEAPDEWDARLHLLRFIPGPAAHPASAQADGKQMFAERG